MKDVLVLKDLEQIKAISQPYRIKILEAFEDKPATAKLISERLGEPHAKINYHLKSLLKVGIIELVEEVVKLGIVEKYYCPVAYNYILDSASMKISDSNVRESINQYQIAMFETISGSFYDAIELSEKRPSSKIHLLSDVFLSKEDVKVYNDKISDIFTEIRKKHSERKEGAVKYSFASIIVPEENE